MIGKKEIYIEYHLNDTVIFTRILRCTIKKNANFMFDRDVMNIEYKIK
jgi:hypothetical protein